MKITRDELLPGVYLNHIRTDKFKIASMSLTLLTQLRQETAAMNALIPAVLCRGSARYNDMEKLSRRLDELYGASVSPSARRIGEIQCIGLTATFPEAAFLPAGENVTQNVISLLCEMLLDPATRGGLLLQEYVNSEREKLAEVIRSRINNKGSYSMMRCLQEMCCFEDYACGRFGRLEECEEIRYRKLTKQYREVLSTAPVEIFYCGRETREEIRARLRDALCTMPRGELRFDIGTDVRMNTVEEQARKVTEEMDISQARLVLGFRLGEIMEEPDKPALSVFNALYGSGVTSRLFTNVRERMQLCYSVTSIIDAHKGIMLAAAGIDGQTAEQAKDEILHQLDEIRDGSITGEELEIAKAGVLSDLAAMLDNPGVLESFCMGNLIDGFDVTPEEYASLVREVTREDVIAIAKSIVLDMVYLLKGGETAFEEEEDEAREIDGPEDLGE